MALSFLFVRVIFTPSQFIKAIFENIDVLSTKNIYTQFMVPAGFAVITLLNCYWCFLIWRGLFNAIKKRSLKKSNTRTNNNTNNTTTTSIGKNNNYIQSPHEYNNNQKLKIT